MEVQMSTETTVNGADFVSGQPIDNPFLPWKPGTTFTYTNADNTVIDTETVLSKTTKIAGVDTTVVLDEVKDANTGQVLEHTLDHYAQDTKGNVWYFGEESKEFENGKLVSKDSWKAGIQGAEPGIIMEAHLQVGDSYDQENAPGVGNSPHIAQDHAEVTSLDGSATVPAGHFTNLLVTLETSPLEPGAAENKYYSAGIGEVFGNDLVTGEQERLVSVSTGPILAASPAQDSSLTQPTSATLHMTQAMASFGASSSGLEEAVSMTPNDPHTGHLVSSNGHHP
jgi:hypothetical protein